MTINIRDAINTPYIDQNTYSNLLSLLNGATAGISFWGTRYITVNPCALAIFMLPLN